MGTIGEIIDRDHSEIVQQWLSAAQRSPSARELNADEMASTMPAYLSLLARQDESELGDQQRRLIEHHLSSRLREGFSLNEILTEYASLARLVFQRLGAVDLPLVDGARLANELLLTSVAVTTIFNEQLLEDEQTLKRYLRLLRSSVGEEASPQPAHAPPLRKRLEQALALVMEAMGGQTAALLLFDPASDELILSAAIGDAHEALTRHVSAHDAASWAGKIASIEGEAIAIADVETTELTVSEALRSSGIHSLLGVRLSTHHLLRGVLYVGLRQKQSFSASAVRRLENLGEALTGHLDHARLYAALRGTIEQGALSDDMRQRFVSLVMRDLEAPLATARALAQHIVSDGNGARAAAVKVVHELDHVERMIEDLLDAHRLRAGARLQLRIADCDLAATAARAVDELRERYGDRFVLRADEEVRGMWDSGQLHGALVSLAGNAIKHGARDAPVHVTIGSGSGGAELAVRNAGAPITPEEQARLFHLFSRDRLMANKPGWGIGLTLVWGCAEAHGGNVTVESTAESGTTFTLRIPWDARPYADL